MWHIIETIQLILYIFLGIFSIIAYIKISQKLNRSAEQLHPYQKRRLEQLDDIPDLQNINDSEMFPSKKMLPSKSVSIKKGIRLLSGEKIYLSERDLAAVMEKLQCENEQQQQPSNLDTLRPLQTRF
uniref:Uncharacterized protein n=1 Tax=Panagrolaimus sp. PS1159 TaxID=55785 RepID=A0AC35F486_9BILA